MGWDGVRSDSVKESPSLTEDSDCAEGKRGTR